MSELQLQPFTPIWDYWRCDTCHGFFVTVQVVAGNVPDGVSCKVTKGCTGKMPSFKQPPLEQWPVVVPREADAEWYRPNALSQMKMKTTNRKLWFYVQKGGLILRPASNTTPPFLPLTNVWFQPISWCNRKARWLR